MWSDPDAVSNDFLTASASSRLSKGEKNGLRKARLGRGTPTEKGSAHYFIEAARSGFRRKPVPGSPRARENQSCCAVFLAAARGVGG